MDNEMQKKDHLLKLLSIYPCGKNVFSVLSVKSKVKPLHSLL